MLKAGERVCALVSRQRPSSMIPLESKTSEFLRSAVIAFEPNHSKNVNIYSRHTETDVNSSRSTRRYFPSGCLAVLVARVLQAEMAQGLIR
jgi:hypothetical protein